VPQCPPTLMALKINEPVYDRPQIHVLGTGQNSKNNNDDMHIDFHLEAVYSLTE